MSSRAPIFGMDAYGLSGRLRCGFWTCSWTCSVARGLLILIVGGSGLFSVPSHAQQLPASADSLPAPAVSVERLTLRDVVERVRQQNFDVRIARGDATIAARDATLGNAGFLPVLDVSFGQQGTEASTVGGGSGFGAGPGGNLGGTPGGNPGGSPGGSPGEAPGRIPIGGAQTSFNTTVASAALSWTLLDFGRGPAYRRLQADRSRAQVAADATQEGALQDATTAYFDIVRQQALLATFRETVALSEERLRLTSVQARAGTATELDAGLARVDLNADRSALLEQEATLTGLKSDLQQRLGRTGAATFIVEDTIRVDPSLRLDDLRAVARQSNRQLETSRRSLRVADLLARETARGRFPTLTVATGYQLVGFATGAEPDPFNQNDTFTYGATMSLGLFDGFNRRRQIDTAQIRALNAGVAVEQQEARIDAELDAAYARYRTNLARLDLERENVGVARRNVEIAYAQLRAGTITAVDLRQVQLSLLDTQSRLLEASFEAKRGEIDLLRLSGALMERAPTLDAGPE